MPTEAQIKEIEDLISEAQQLDKDKKPAEAAEKYQKAIELADEYFEIPDSDKLREEPQYDKDQKADGKTRPHDGKTCDVTIGPSGFTFPPGSGTPSAIWLAAVKAHEIYGHCALYLGWEREGGMLLYKWKVSTVEEEEVISYNVMLEWAERLGLTEEMIATIKRLKKHYYGLMPKDRQRIWGEKEPWLKEEGDEEEKQKKKPELFYKSRLGTFELKEGSSFKTMEGEEVRLSEDRNLNALANEFFNGSVRDLVAHNPELSVSVIDISRVFLGDFFDPDGVNPEKAELQAPSWRDIDGLGQEPPAPIQEQAG